MNYSAICDKLLLFLTNYLQNSGLSSFSVGVSGGIDSAVVATLCSKVTKTHALIMPTNASSKQNIDDAIKLVKDLKISHEVINIQKIADSFNEVTTKNSILDLGNIYARIRMILLYNHSLKNNSLVVGTTNKTELLLGYGTIYGDLAYGLNPIGNLFKSDIFEFAKYLGIDQNIINKIPSADLWEGQSDESDFGYSYKQIDLVLKYLFSLHEVEVDKISSILNDDLIEKLRNKFDKNLVDFIIKKIKINNFKLKIPPIAELN